ncbi:hydantoinase B/oxoprolinase family protein, partial [bacterium]|nr:hydantoinase B/oxoprolinase family protein [bacterium]
EGKKGQNIRILENGKRIELPGNISYQAETGEELIIKTPGGGGFGPASRMSES